MVVAEKKLLLIMREPGSRSTAGPHDYYFILMFLNRKLNNNVNFCRNRACHTLGSEGDFRAHLQNFCKIRSTRTNFGKKPPQGGLLAERRACWPHRWFYYSTAPIALCALWCARACGHVGMCFGRRSPKFPQERMLTCTLNFLTLII